MPHRLATPDRRRSAGAERATPRPAAAALSRRGDQAEREANTLAASVLARGHQPPSPGFAGRGSLGSASPLAPETRSFFEPRFGRDFSRVRVRHDGEAGAAARSLGARAYVLGEEIVWNGPAHYAVPQSTGLLAHELAHIAAGHASAAPQTAFRAEAELPTEAEQRDINKLFNPQQSEDVAVPPVTNPVGFKTELKARAAMRRAARFPAAHSVQVSAVSLTTTDMTDVTAIAADRIRTTFHDILSPAIDLANIRSKIKYIPSDPGDAPAPDEATLTADTLGGLDVSAVDTVLMQDGPASAPDTSLGIIKKFHVLAGGRDNDLYEETIKAIRDESPAQWRTIALSMRGWDIQARPMLQRHIESEGAEAPSSTRRRGRWMNLGTSIHEILHAVTHPDFSSVTFEAENRRLGTEGFTEYFTRQVYQTVVDEASGNPVLRLSVEGSPGPPPIVPPKRQSYEGFLAQVKEIVDILGNEENLRQAYFRGRVEYIGFGKWNELRRGLPAGRRHSLGAAVLFQTSSGGTVGLDRPYLRADWGYLILGRGGDFQLDLRAGAGVTYVSEGDRLGIGPQVTGTIRGGHLFLTGGLLVQGSASLAGGFNDPRLDTIVRIEAGAQIGRFHVGPTIEVLVPITEPDAAKRSAQVFGGVGLSFVLGN